VLCCIADDPTEKGVAQRSVELDDRVTRCAQRRIIGRQWSRLLLRPQVDAFSTLMMVMAPDAAVRGERLALLERVLG